MDLKALLTAAKAERAQAPVEAPVAVNPNTGELQGSVQIHVVQTYLSNLLGVYLTRTGSTTYSGQLHVPTVTGGSDLDLMVPRWAWDKGKCAEKLACLQWPACTSAFEPGAYGGSDGGYIGIGGVLVNFIVLDGPAFEAWCRATEFITDIYCPAVANDKQLRVRMFRRIVRSELWNMVCVRQAAWKAEGLPACTCEGCDMQDTCECSYDEYNVQGDCLAIK